MSSRFDTIHTAITRSSSHQRLGSVHERQSNNITSSNASGANFVAWNECLHSLKNFNYLIPLYLKQTSYAETAERFLHKIKDIGEDKNFKDIAQEIGTSLPQNFWPLPSRWSEQNKLNSLEVSKNGREVSFVGPGRGSDSDAASLRANCPMSPHCGIYYFEVKILSKGKSGFIGIGFCKSTVPLNRLPGWEPDSWGYHGDDGHSFCCKGTGKPYAARYTTGDTIGCGVDFENQSAFYTKNGFYLGKAFKGLSGEFYPSIGLRTLGESISANFGTSQFIYDIDRHIRVKKDDFYNMVLKSSTLNKQEERRIITNLIEGYLRHNGHIKALKSFIQDNNTEKRILGNESKTERDDIALIDTNAYRRQKIRDALMLGNIDETIELTKMWFPKALTEDFEILFKLKCQKFVELIRNSLESQESESTESDIDMISGSLQGNQKLRSQSLSPEAQFDMQKCIDYGRALYAEYKDTVNESLKKYLNDTVSLLLFSNSSQLPLGYLINESERRNLAEKLIAAIYKSEGLNTSSDLEMMIKQTKNIFSHLRQKRVMQTAFVNFEADFSPSL